MAVRPVVVWNVQRLLRTHGSAIARSLGMTRTDGWNEAAYRSKIQAVGAMLRAATGGATPALLALIEVEDAKVVADVCAACGWRTLRNVVPAGERVAGYDVALLYDPAVLSAPLQASSWTQNGRFSTRDGLFADFQIPGRGDLSILVTHWPSRKLAESEALRIAAASFCAGMVERALKFPKEDLFDRKGTPRLPDSSKLLQRWFRPLLVVGDFNDEPWSPSLGMLGAITRNPDDAIRPPALPATKGGRASIQSVTRYLELRPRLFNPSWEVLNREPPGTHVFGGEWALLDQILVSGGVLSDGNGPRLIPQSLRVFAPREIQLAQSTIQVCTRGGTPIPFDPRTRRGVSDHLPLIVDLDF